MNLGVIIQQPSESLDYDLFYGNWFDGRPDKIDAVVATIQPSGATVTPVIAADDVVKIWLEGGVDGQTYNIEVTVTTDAGRVKQDEIEVIIEEFI